jgi:hypothetical protein
MPVGRGAKPVPRVRKTVARPRIGQYVTIRISASIPGERAITEFLSLVAASYEFLFSNFDFPVSIFQFPFSSF